MLELPPSVQNALRFQSYIPSSPIPGVQLQPLKKHRSLEGSFMELFRLHEGMVKGAAEFELRQLSASWAAPHRLNAFHLHPKRPQEELWCVLEGELLVWLVDVRTPELRKQAVILSGEEPSLLRIPHGVAHGYRAGTRGALLLYATNSPFDPQDPNEGRLPWDFFGSELWEEDRG